MPGPYAEAFDYSRGRKISPMLSMSPSDCRKALSFLGELQKLTILIDAMRALATSVRRLRSTAEWWYVEREVNIRASR